MLDRIISRINGKTLGAIAVLLIAQQMPEDRYILYGIAIVIASLRDPCGGSKETTL
ncbi:MAG: hypothetical protein K6U12_13975 [Armatimonadetes bacterium]|nr:hypothetical protein [Armatimonadota bacterium]